MNRISEFRVSYFDHAIRPGFRPIGLLAGALGLSSSFAVLEAARQIAALFPKKTD